MRGLRVAAVPEHDRAEQELAHAQTDAEDLAKALRSLTKNPLPTRSCQDVLLANTLASWTAFFAKEGAGSPIAEAERRVMVAVLHSGHVWA